jgi:hypothetical protein
MAYYSKHPNLIIPDDNCEIWRYMDFPKFQSMIQRGSIFFSRVDKQTDKLEGEYPIRMLDELERRLGTIKSDDGASYTFAQWHKQKEIPSRLLSCWSVWLNETRKMWSTYTTTIESVSIRSTIGRLKNCFHLKGNGKLVVWIGKIRYGDEENKLPHSFHKWNINYYLFPFFAKKETFRWENEVRATVNISRKNQLIQDDSPNGCFIKADLHVLIDSVWVHPQATKDFRQRVGSMLLDYDYGEIPIRQSSWESVPE